MKKPKTKKSVGDKTDVKYVVEPAIVKELDKVKDKLEDESSNPTARAVLKILCGILIGVGAVLPGVSGGVLCVIFGIYPLVMDMISHPLTNLKNKLKILMPYMVGIVIGFWGVAKMLEIL